MSVSSIPAARSAEFLDRQAAALYLGVAASTLSLWAHTGKHRDIIPFARYGKKAIYRKADLDKFLDAKFRSAAF